MIHLSLYRQQVHDIMREFFPFIQMMQTTRLKNCAAASLHSPAFLSALAINCVQNEIMWHIKKKEINTSKEKIKLQFTEAQAVVLYQTLLELPIDSQKIHLCNLRNALVQILDKEITARKIYNLNVFYNKKDSSATSFAHYFDE